MPISGKLALDDAHVPAKAMSTASVLRWLAIFVFVLSTALNYLDRLLLAAVAPTVKAEFHLSNVQYGQIISAFSIVYAVMAPAAGWLIDRAGLSLSMTLAMSVWSMAGIFTGITRSFSGLFVSRTVLGIGEAACIPAFGKVNGLYLAPRELAFGTAVNQVGIALGSIAAPLLVAAMAPVWGWRSVFVISGALGFVWIPLWWFTSRRISPPQTAQKREPDSDQIGRVLRDRRIWALMVANALVMTLYTLWTNWTTVFFVDRYGLSEAVANRQFAWVPTVFATLGGFCGGWMTYRAIREGTGEFSARMRTCWVAAIAVVVTSLVPAMPTPLLAAGAISFSFFWCLAISTNLYAMPIGFFGVGRAGFGVSMLTCSYGLMQTVLSPAIGFLVDHFGFTPVCWSMSLLPLVGIAILQIAGRPVPATKA